MKPNETSTDRATAVLNLGKSLAICLKLTTKRHVKRTDREAIRHVVEECLKHNPELRWIIE